MTENDPGGGDHDIPDAGTVGARREEVGTPIPSDERMSLNLPPKEPGGGAGKADSGTSKESVRRDIERDRRELGDTVEALMHKTDVKGRVQETATHVGDELRRVRAATATTATEMVGRVKEATPVEIKDAAGRVTTEAGKRPVALVAAVAVLGLVVFRALSRGRGRGGRKRR